MGNFYVNVTVKGPDRSDIAKHLERIGCEAYLAPDRNEITTLCETQCDTQDTVLISEFVRELSAFFGCPALAVVNHGDDILAYVLYNNGERQDAYNSSPWYFDGEQLGGDFELPADQIPPEPQDWDVDPELPAGGDTAALVELFGNEADIAEVDRVLHTPETEESDEFVFAFERHTALLKALGYPDHPVVFGTRYLRKQTPEQLAAEGIIKIGGAE